MLSYLYQTKDLVITYGGETKMPNLSHAGCKPAMDFDTFTENKGLGLWTDATFGAKMQSAYIIMYMNAAISWASRKIKVAATSAAETETIGGVQGCKAVKFTRAVMSFLEMIIKGPTPLLVDNEPMWFNVRNDVVSVDTSHWGVWQRFVRECYLHLIIDAFKIGTDDELADLLTKAIAREDEKYKRFRNDIMNIE